MCTVLPLVNAGTEKRLLVMVKSSQFLQTLIFETILLEYRGHHGGLTILTSQTTFEMKIFWWPEFLPLSLVVSVLSYLWMT